MQGLFRRFGQGSEGEVRPKSSSNASDRGGSDAPRASEQISHSGSGLGPQMGDRSVPSINIPPSEKSAGDSTRRSTSPDFAPEATPHRRFPLLKFRHASDSQLAASARLHAQAAATPPMPRPPEIITTAPTLDIDGRSTKKRSKLKLPGRMKGLGDETQNVNEGLRVEKKERRKTFSDADRPGKVTFDESNRNTGQALIAAPPAYGDDSISSLAIPVNRLSESSRSDASSADHGVYATTTTTTHTIQTTTTFFRLPRKRNKGKGPLFPLPDKVSADRSGSPSARASTSFSSSIHSPSTDSQAILPLRQPPHSEGGQGFASPLPSPSGSALAKSSLTFALPGSALARHDSTTSAQSTPVPSRLGLRERSSTSQSLKMVASEDPLQTPTVASARTSTSVGRKSLGDIFTLKLRHNSDPHFPRHGSSPATPGSNTSKNNSMQLTREPVVLPERLDDDTPAKYLVRLEEAVSRGIVASLLSKGTDTFSQAVLRSYMRGFGFFGDPMDMAIRKLLMEAELPKETQQIDRCLQAFANRYHECNPGIYASPDQAYFIAFSLLILHTDVFNKNNKHKMQKADYLKNTKGEGIFDDILECFYDNISYTPFIHVEDDLDINGERIIPHKIKRKSIFPRGSSDLSKRPTKEPIDPYTLIIDSKLDTLRPNLKDVMHLAEHYSYLGTAKSLNLSDLQKTFFRTGILQIVSARSRPDAFMSEKTLSNPENAHPGIVDIKITKVGLLWRKDAKKKKTRSPWQEWGAILTGAQLYFFRNTAWIKSLIHQHESHVKAGHDGIPVIFKPPLEQFKPDALMSTDDAVALLDATYKKHKHSFSFVRHGGFEETFIADNEEEMNDWLAKLNYAAAFRTSGVRMRGVVGGNYEGQRSRGIRRLETSNELTKSVQTPSGEVTIVSGRIDMKMAQDILAARREIMSQKIAEAEDKLGVAEKQLDTQLRNARHLQILAPIQAKSRDQVLSAAARMSANLKWLRMEIWRLKCHRDILKMDLEEENGNNEGQSTKLEATSNTQSVERSKLSRLESKSTTKGGNKANQLTPSASHVTHISSQSTPHEHDFDMDDVFHTPPQLSHASSFHKAQASWELPPLNFDAQNVRRLSDTSLPHSPKQDKPGSVANINDNKVASSTVDSSLAIRSSTPQVDDGEQAVLEQSGLVSAIASPDSRRSDRVSNLESDEAKDGKSDATVDEKKDKSEPNKIRRSLHRTLRDAHGPSHHRSRKGKDSSSSAGLSDEVAKQDDVLARGTGSFVVHGKKASVITFGSELQSMTSDERLRLRISGHRDEIVQATRNSTEGFEEFKSALAEPIEFRRRNGSAASTVDTEPKSTKGKCTEDNRVSSRNTVYNASENAILSDDGTDYGSDTSVNIRDVHAAQPSEAVDGDDEDDDEEDDEESHIEAQLKSNVKQRAFFTPDSRMSPAAAADDVHDSKSPFGKDVDD